MSKFLYPIYKLKTKSYIKWWLYHKKAGGSGVLSEILEGFSFNLENTLNRKFKLFEIEGNSVQDGSPSPETQVPILSSGDNGSINEKIQTRNWFDVSKISQLIKNGTTTSAGITNIDNVITINKSNGQYGSYAMNYLMPIKSGQITVSFKALLSGTNSSTRILVTLYNSTATIYATTSQTKNASSKDKWLDYSATFELNQEAINGIHLDIQAANTGNVIQIKDVQVELGSTATPYVEHEEQDYSIFVQQPMRSIGDVRDCFVKVNGNWYKYEVIKKIVLTGNENWIYYTNIGEPYFFYTPDYTNIIKNKIVDNSIILCNYFQNRGKTYKPSGQGIFVNADSSGKIENGNLSVTTYDWGNNVETFKQFLREKKPEVYFAVKEPTKIEITDETLISQLDAMQELRTYKNVTHISSQDETPAYLKIQYYKEG